MGRIVVDGLDAALLDLDRSDGGFEGLSGRGTFLQAAFEDQVVNCIENPDSKELVLRPILTNRDTLDCGHTETQADTHGQDIDIIDKFVATKP
jgi:hypothetical protein